MGEGAETAVKTRRFEGAARRRGAAAVLAGAALLAGGANAQPYGKAIPAWDASGETNAASIDHSAWQDTLNAYLSVHDSGVNRFDYAELEADAGGSAKLDGYLTSLQRIDPRRYSRAEQKAYWINFYNAWTVRIVRDAYPVDSIRDIGKGFLSSLLSPGPWDDAHVRVAGRDLTLDDIEHGILRPIWRDNRIHYAVNCASYGCPNLLPTAFTAANTEALLEAAARAYVNHPRGVDFAGGDSLVVSSLYKWYAEDFGGTEEGVLKHLVRYAEKPLADRLRNFSGTVGYEYDWRLNRP